MDNKEDIGLSIETHLEKALKQLRALRKETKDQTEATDELGDKAEDTGKKLKNAFDIKQLGAWILSIQKYTDTMIRLTKRQVDYNKSMQKLQVAYGEVNSSGEKLVKTMADLSGIDIAQLTSSLGTFRQFTSSLGLANDQASLLAENMLKLSNDMASYYNEDTVEMARQLVSGLTGEAETLKILGADVTDNAVKQKALALGIQTNTTNMSLATKATLRYLLVIDQLKNAQGNYAATINDVSTQTKIWNAQIDTLKRQLGAFILPLLQTMLPVLNGILMVVNELLGMLLGLFGIDVPMQSIVNKSNDFKTNLEGAGEAAKEAQKSLRGFDKLNVIKTPTASSGGTGTVGGVDPKALAALDEYNDKLKEVHNKAVKIRNTIMKWFGFTKDTNGEWKHSGKLIDKIKIAVAVILVAFLTLYPIIKGISKIKSIFGKKKAKDIKDVATSVDKLKDGFGSFLKSIGTGIKVFAILGGLVLVIKSIIELMDAFSKSGLSVGEVLSLIGGVLLEVVAAVWLLEKATKSLSVIDAISITIVLLGLASALSSIADLIEIISTSGFTMTELLVALAIPLGMVEVLMWSLVGAALILGSNPLALIAVIALAGALSAILLVMKKTLPIILEAVGSFIDTVAPRLNEILDTIGTHIENIIYALGDVLPKVIESVGDLFTKIFDGISKTIDTFGNTFVNILNAVADLVHNVLKDVLDFISRLGWAIDSFVEGAISAVTKLINFIVSGVEYLINTLIVDAVNSLLKKVKENKIAEILGVDKKIKLLSDVSIRRFTPRFAQGGFPEKGELFIAREAGAEMVGSINNKTTVANNDQIVDGISAGVAKAIMATGRNVNVNITAEGDTEGLLDFITFKQKQKDRQYGF